MASEVQICNRALQKLGAKRITSLDDDSTNARACNFAYEPVLEAELRAHPWNFAIKRAQLAASATSPAFGKENAFPLPSDFLRLLPPDPVSNRHDLDWQIEGRSILTDDDGPLNIRYIAKVSDPNQMDPLFREALSNRLAQELCEELTQSNTKKEGLREDRKEIIRDARKMNAFESPSAEPPTDPWLTARD